MKFSTILSSVFLLATSVIAQKCSCGKGDVPCYAKCLNLPNPTEDQVLLTQECNTDCTFNGNGSDDCFISCVKEAYLATNTKVSTSKPATKSTERVSSSSSSASSSSTASSVSSSSSKESSSTESSKSEPSSSVKPSSTASSTSKPLFPTDSSSGASSIGSSLVIGAVVAVASYLYL